VAGPPRARGKVTHSGPVGSQCTMSYAYDELSPRALPAQMKAPDSLRYTSRGLSRLLGEPEPR